MPVETQKVWMATYVKHDDLSFVYSGDKQHPDDHDVTMHMHPYDGVVYNYVPEEQNWTPNLDAAWAAVRKERNVRIEAFRWKIDRQRDLVDLGLATPETLTPLLNYVQQLRDIPQTQSDPFSIVYPEEPVLG
jgi:hypothetical protein